MAKRKRKTQYEEQKKEVHAFFSQNGDRVYTLTDLYNHLDVYDQDEKIFIRLMVEDLEEEGKLRQAGRGRYVGQTPGARASASFVEGRVDFVNPRFAFIRFDENEADVFVDAEDLGGALDGDRVRVAVSGQRRNGKNPEGKVVEVLERGRTEVVGKIRVFGSYALVTPDNRGFHEDIFIPKEHINGATKDDLVIVQLVQYPTQHTQATGKVAEVLGKSGDNNAEMHAIMAEFGLPVKFPDEVIAEAEAIPEEISAEEIALRRDFRSSLTFTIDPHDAKDFDDALSFRILENGNMEVGIHIADVTHYVKTSSRLEAEAFRRATSVYLVDRTIPMLPEKLSNQLCSLRPNEDKLVFSAVFEMNDQAEVISEWFGRGIIHSDRRFAYEEAQELLEMEEESEEDKYIPILQRLNRMAKNLRTQRFAKGAFNFETNEVKFNLDDTGKPVGIYVKVRKDAHKLIEEFMLLANRKVAEYVYNLNKEKSGEVLHPFTMVYRVHEPPNPEKLETFSRFAGKLGFVIKTDNQDVLAKSLNNLMTDIEGTPMQNVLESLAVRTMSKARYSTSPLGHFGLAFDHYSHFTSPIRRYPDMMAHRMLQHYLDKGKSLDESDFEDKCKHSSDQEKLAAEAERASIKYKQVEYMSYQDRGRIYDGVVTGVTDFGVFAEIEGTGCEGMIRLADLTDDFYEYDPDNYRLTGKKKGKIIGFGNTVKVRIKSTDLERRSMDLELVSVEGTAFSQGRAKQDFRRGGRTRVREKRGEQGKRSGGAKRKRR